ncbi:PIN domain-containing protein [Magnetococcales bacterium HHB-1]
MSKTKKQILLIDLDNCGHEIKKLSQSIKNYTHIICCYGADEPKIPLSVAQILAPALCSQRLEFVHMEKGGRNAADFGLAFWAGKLIKTYGANSQFFILSADTDLDHVIYLIQQEGRQATRLLKSEDKPPAKQTKKEISLEDAVEQYLKRSLLKDTPRPTTERGLRRRFNSLFQNRQRTFTAQEAIQNMVEQDILTIDSSGQISYLDTISGDNPEEISPE